MGSPDPVCHHAAVVDEANLHQVRELLREADTAGSWPARLETLSRLLLGRPYLVGPLVGSATEPERLVTRLDGFDCVTYVETVLALARCARPDEFADRLTALRYEHGRIDWLARNHYMSAWLQRNGAAGFVAPVVVDVGSAGAVRTLSILPDYPAREVALRWLEASSAELLPGLVRTGDVVCFVSTRDDLDTFHVGLLVTGPSLLLRHAARSRGGVVQEPLADFLAREQTPGMLLARPLE